MLPYKTDQLGNELKSCRLPIPIPAWNTLATLYEAYLQQTQYMFPYKIFQFYHTLVSRTFVL